MSNIRNDKRFVQAMHLIWTQEKHDAWVAKREKEINPDCWQEKELKKFMQGIGLTYKAPGE